MRHALIGNSAPTAAQPAGGFVFLLPAPGIVVATSVAGVRASVRTNPWMAERL